MFEVPPEQMADPSMAQKLLAAAGYDDGRTLSQVLPPAMREKFNRILAQRGASIAQFDAYEPWFVNLSLMLGISQQMGFSPQQGLDTYLMQRAAAQGKATGGLETIETQLSVLDATPMTEQVISLKEFLDKPTEMPGMLSDLHQAWRDGDIARLDTLTREEMRSKTPETYRIVNTERNDAWVPQIQQMLDGAEEGRHAGRGRRAAPARRGWRDREAARQGIHGRARVFGMRAGGCRSGRGEVSHARFRRIALTDWLVIPRRRESGHRSVATTWRVRVWR